MMPSVSSPPDSRTEKPPLLRSLVGVLFVPDRTMPEVVAAGRYGVALMVLLLCAGLSAAAIGPRLSPSLPSARSAEAPQTEREAAEATGKARVVEQVKLGLSTVIGTPVTVVLLALGLFLLGRYVGGRPTFRRSMAAACYGSLPMAVKSLVAAAAALRSVTLDPGAVAKLATFPGAPRLLAVLDPFAVWCTVLFGFGLAQAAGLSRKKAFVTVFVGFAIVLVVTRILQGGDAPPGGHR